MVVPSSRRNSGGIAVLSVRGGLEFEVEVTSGTAAVWPAVEALRDANIEVHCLRDLTHGGLSSALCIERDCPWQVYTLHSRRPRFRFPMLFEERVKSAFVPECDAKGAIEVLRSEPVSSSGAARIGTGRPASSGIARPHRRPICRDCRDAEGL